MKTKKNNATKFLVVAAAAVWLTIGDGSMAGDDMSLAQDNKLPQSAKENNRHLNGGLYQEIECSRY